MKNLLPINVKQTLYNTLILPHLQYNLIVWGHKLSKISKTQKRAIRLVAAKKFTSHTDPIFKTQKCLKIEDLYLQKCIKLYHKYVHNTIPQSFAYLNFKKVDKSEQRNLRSQNDYEIPFCRIDLTKTALKYKIPECLNKCADIVKDKIMTSTYHGIGTFIKYNRLGTYTTTCEIPNCYSCQTDSN